MSKLTIYIGKIILRNEKASKVYTTEVIASIIQEEAKGRFESRVGIPGHFQQGKEPSPMDRVRAVRFAVRSLQHIEKFAGMSPSEIEANPEATALIGIRGAKVCLSSMEQIERDETDWKHRRPKEEYWHGLTGLGDILSGRPRHDNAPAEIRIMPV